MPVKRKIKGKRKGSSAKKVVAKKPIKKVTSKPPARKKKKVAGKPEYKVGKGKPPIHGQIKKGEVRNPLGAKAHKSKFRVSTAFKQLTAKEVVRVGSLVLNGDVDGLKAIMQDARATVLMKWVATAATKAMLRGDISVLNALLDRTVGRVTEKIELTGKDGAAVEISEEARVERRARIKQNLKALKELDEHTNPKGN